MVFSLFFKVALRHAEQFLEAPEFRNVTLRCLSEIAGLNVGPEYDPKFVILFAMVMTSVNRMIPPSTGMSSFSA